MHEQRFVWGRQRPALSRAYAELCAFGARRWSMTTADGRQAVSGPFRGHGSPLPLYAPEGLAVLPIRQR